MFIRASPLIGELTHYQNIPASTIYSHWGRILDARCHRHVAPVSPVVLLPFAVYRMHDGTEFLSHTDQAPVCKQWLGVLCQAYIQEQQHRSLDKNVRVKCATIATHFIFGLTLLITVPQFSTGQCVPVRMCWIRQLRQTVVRNRNKNNNKNEIRK